MKVLQEGIETNKHNFTRFLVVADPWQVDEIRKQNTVLNKANIVFTLPTLKEVSHRFCLFYLFIIST